MLNVVFNEVCSANSRARGEGEDAPPASEIDECAAQVLTLAPFWGPGLCRGIPAGVRTQQDDPRLIFCRIRPSDPQGSQSSDGR